MAWRRPGDKPLSEPMMVRLSTHICVTRPQWVNFHKQRLSPWFGIIDTIPDTTSRVNHAMKIHHYCDVMWGIHRSPVNSPHKGPVTRKMFQFDDVIMRKMLYYTQWCAVIGIAIPYDKIHDRANAIVIILHFASISWMIWLLKYPVARP